MPMRPRTCPTHRAPMQRVVTVTPEGKDLELDRCGQCGALWFDAGELELLSKARAMPAGPGFEHCCPSCSDPAKDPSVGGVFASARCNSCGGTFLDAATIARLGAERLPHLPEAPAPRELEFRCGRCGERFPYAQGNATASGLVCRDCRKHAVGGGGSVAEAGELQTIFSAVLRFLGDGGS